MSFKVPCFDKVTLTLFLLSFFAFPVFGQMSESMVKEVLVKMVASAELVDNDISEYRMTDHYMSKKGQIDHMYFCQTVNGIDVHNAVGSIHVLPNGSIISKNVQFVKNLSNRMNGKGSNSLTAIQAVEAAAKAKNYKISSPLQLVKNIGGPSKKAMISTGGFSASDIQAQLKYYNTGKMVKLAWEVSIDEPGGQHYWIVFIDANTGEMLSSKDMVITCFEGDLHEHRDEKRPVTPGIKVKKTEHDQKILISGSIASSSKQSSLVTSFNPRDLKRIMSVSAFAPDSYFVYALPIESPNYGDQTTVVNSADPTASPFGWHDTNGVAGAEYTITRGNNAYAYADRDFNNMPDAGSSPDGGAMLDFPFSVDTMLEPDQYIPASVTNLFYMTNMMHDVMYHYGFDEASGNFQENNYGNGGVGGDYVLAEAQDAANGSGNCNANFNTNVDGVSPRMQMFICDLGNPERDGSLDNGVIAHEYGHGISFRLVGGPSTVCLGGAEQMGEGWSDFYGLILTIEPGDVGADQRGIGTWLIGQPFNGLGIRATPMPFGVDGFPYSTDMTLNPETYASVAESGRLPGVHGVGYVWAEMLWEMTWNLIDNYGFDPNLYTGTGGNNIALHLVTEGLKMTPCTPGFVDGRNAILAADTALYGGQYSCLIWESFAKRGLGVSASQGSSSSRLDGVEAFDLPPSCLFTIDSTMSICDPGSAEYNVNVGELFNNSSSDPVTLSTFDNPMGTTIAFNTNPGQTPLSSVMTVTSTGTPPGIYIIGVVANDGVFQDTLYTELIIFDQVPNPPVLVNPVNYDVVVSDPLLTWQSAPDAESYRIIVSENSDLSAPTVDFMTTETSYLFTGTVAETTYFWAVEAENECGTGDLSDIYSFTTLLVVETGCNITQSTNVPIAISDVGTPVIFSTITIATAGTILDLNVLNLNITHTFISDLDVELQSPMGTTVLLVSDICGAQDNMLLNFDDSAPTAIIPCPPTTNLYYIPLEALSAFNGENMDGVWTLIVRDFFNADGGSLNSWSLEICAADNLTCYADTDGDGYGDPENVTVGNFGSCGPGFVLNALDCDDTDETIFPGQGCALPIPTLGEWSLLILAFMVSILGILGIRQWSTSLEKQTP